LKLTSEKPRLLFITHDANRAGAQLFLVNIMKELKKKGYQTGLLIANSWGGLKSDFAEASTRIHELPYSVPKLKKILGKSLKSYQDEFLKKIIASYSYDIIYANTIATAEVAVKLKHFSGLPLISHIHELKHSLELYSSPEDRKDLLTVSNQIIACSDAVANNLKGYPFVTADCVETIHSFVDNEEMLKVVETSNKTLIRNEFDLPKEKLLIGACGNSEWRKGMDLFVELAQKSQNNAIENLHFIWIGARDDNDEYTENIRERIRENNIRNITLIPQTPKAKELINALDIFVVSSREDPFPLVMLEAALCQKPILGFEDTGGCTEFVKNTCGWLAPYEDIDTLYELLKKMIANESERITLGKQGQHEVLIKYSFSQSFKKIEEVLLSI
jgi:glycosyltransferase involved in cell wall biosynthesis